MTKAEQYECPVCKGEGRLPLPAARSRRHTQAELKNSMAKTLADAGYSYQQICDLIGWKSKNSALQGVRKARAASPEKNGEYQVQRKGAQGL